MIRILDRIEKLGVAIDAVAVFRGAGALPADALRVEFIRVETTALFNLDLMNPTVTEIVFVEEPPRILCRNIAQRHPILIMYMSHIFTQFEGRVAVILSVDDELM